MDAIPDKATKNHITIFSILEVGIMTVLNVAGRW